MSEKDGEDVLGEVITFYSYKGGTARTTALANVAYLLAEKQTQGKGVLMIDWDLEAPGLHHFFHDRFSKAAAEPTRIGRPFDEVPGLIDLFLKFEQETPTGPPETFKDAEERAQHCLKSVQIEDYVVSTGIPYLSLMTAGRFDLKYASRVNKFDWKGLYNRSPLLFQLLATHLTETEKYRYVLIDSRTGITDVSGICTALMPEKIIAVFTPNQQSLTGVIGQVKWANEYRRKSTDLRPLLALPLPSRIDISEPRLRDAWRLGDHEAGIEGYQPLFEKLFTDEYALLDCNLSRYFDKIQVLHVPAYSYGEKIAAFIEKTDGPGALRPIYRELRDRIDNGSTPWSSMSQAESEAKLAEVEAKAAESSRREKAQEAEASKAKRIARLSTVVAVCFGLLVGVSVWLWKTAYTIDQARLWGKSLFLSIHIVPEMILVPGGMFLQGDKQHSNERPVREVTIKPFAMGKSEVTFKEYDRFAIAEGRSLPNDQKWGRSSRPVINVSWEDATAYAEWLSRQTGRHYRLPTESEWEYAARSGGKDDRWAGISREDALKEFAVYSATRTELVGGRKANGLGLYDMSGNVWEWVEDCWHENYADAPLDGAPWLRSNGGNCGLRVVRGGAWQGVTEDLRVSHRGRDAFGNRTSALGFRLVQDP